MPTRDKSWDRSCPTRLLAAALLATAAACHSDAVTGPDPYFPEGAVAFNPPPRIYTTWWADVQHCSGLSAPFASVHYYYFPATGFFYVKGDEVLGVWAQRGNRITVAEGVALDPFVVRHEMLHALLQTGQHPAAYFSGACGTLVKTSGGAS